MGRVWYNTQLRIVKLIDVMMITLPFGLGWYLAYAENLASPYYERGNWVIIGVFAVLYVTYGRIYEGFRISLNRISEGVASQSLAAAISDGILFLIICLLMKRVPNVLPMLAILSAQVLLSAVWCKLAHDWYFRSFSASPTAVIYDQREGMEQLISEYGLSNKFHVLSVQNVDDALDNDLDILTDVKVVFLCGIHSHERNIILKRCVEEGIELYAIPRIGDVIMSGAERMHMFHLPMLRVRRYDPAPEFLFFKRSFDILASALALITLSPVLLAVTIAVKSDGGPALYRQRRLTKDGKTFDVLKFRSMRVDAEKDGVARLSTGDQDDRITPVGRVIRKFRLDELPQLFNILLGQMSIVGPRPERPEIAAQYEEELPEFSLRLQAKAGLTGYAQVYGKYNTTPYDKLQMDLMYIANPSLAEDFKIIFATIKILFEKESTSGISVGQTTAMSNSETRSFEKTM